MNIIFTFLWLTFYRYAGFGYWSPEMKNRNGTKHWPHCKSSFPGTTTKQGDLIFIIITVTLICTRPIPRKMKAFSFHKIKVTSMLVKAQFLSQLFLDPALELRCFLFRSYKVKKYILIWFCHAKINIGYFNHKAHIWHGSWQKAPRVFSLGLNYSFLIQT